MIRFLENTKDKVEKVAVPVVDAVTPHVDNLAEELYPILDRPVDWMMFLYFFSHIPIAICCDLIGMYPEWAVPTYLSRLNFTYVKYSGDPFMDLSRPTMYWFKSFSYCEAFIQLPFFFFAVYGLLKDKSWVRLPIAIYCAHAISTVIPCLSEIYFNQHAYGLSELQRNVLLALYFPFLLLPTIGIIDNYIKINRRIKQNDKQLTVKKDQ